MDDTRQDFLEYLNQFEVGVVICGFELDMFTKHTLVPVRPCRLAFEHFGRLLGRTFDYAFPLVIDYYGMIKKSSGFMEKIMDIGKYQVKMLQAPVVFFASIRIEDVAEIAPALVSGFPAFKNRLLAERGFIKL
jgi:hypothetical protein